MSQQALWGETVGTAVAVQWGAVLVLAALAGLIGGTSAALSLFGGGAAVAAPNALLALWLSLRVYKLGNAGMTAMMVGEILKIVLTISLLVMVVIRLKPELSMLALVTGVVGALKAQWLALWVTRRV